MANFLKKAYVRSLEKSPELPENADRASFTVPNGYANQTHRYTFSVGTSADTIHAVHAVHRKSPGKIYVRSLNE